MAGDSPAAGGWLVSALRQLGAQIRRLGCLAILLAIGGIVLAFVVTVWVKFSSFPPAYLSLPDHRRCVLEFHHWYSGRYVLSYYDNSTCIGTVRLSGGLLTDPLGFFPGPDGNTVLCLSWLDITNAAFTVDFTKRHPRGATIPEQLEDAVDWSAFEVRACTQREVDFTRQYLRTVDRQTLAHLVRGGSGSEAERQNMLEFLRSATTPSGGYDQNAKAQIVPRD